MAETKAETVTRLRRQASAAERRGKHLLNISVLLVAGRDYDKAVLDAHSMLAEAAALRDHAKRLQSDVHI